MADLHEVIIKFDYQREDFDALDQLQEDLESAVNLRKLGDYDGYDLDEESNRAIFYLTSPDPEAMFKIIKPILQESPILRGVKVDFETGTAEDGTPIVKEYQL